MEIRLVTKGTSMSAPVRVRDDASAAPLNGADVPWGYNRHCTGLLIPQSPDTTSPVPAHVGDSPHSTINQEPATVTELHPATTEADTQPNLPTVEDMNRSTSEALEEELPASIGKNEFDDLVLPDKPQVEDRLQLFLADSYAVIFWASVIVGLVGQIIGFSDIFGFTPVGIAGATLVGGLFEMTMITASSKGLRKIGEDRPWYEIAWYLTGATVSAGVAAYMNLAHWAEINEALAPFFGGLTVIGYCGHIFDHIFDAFRTRRDVQAWKVKKSKIETEQERRAEQARCEWEERQRELAEQQRKALEAQQRRAELAEKNKHLIQRGEELIERGQNRMKQTRPGQRFEPNGEEAVAIGVNLGIEGPTDLGTALVDKGYYRKPSYSFLKRHMATVHKHLGRAGDH